MALFKQKVNRPIYNGIKSTGQPQFRASKMFTVSIKVFIRILVSKGY